MPDDPPPMEAWVRCPACASDAAGWTVTNGRLRFHCPDCTEACSQLVARHQFVRGQRVPTPYRGGETDG